MNNFDKLSCNRYVYMASFIKSGMVHDFNLTNGNKQLCESSIQHNKLYYKENRNGDALLFIPIN